MQIIYLFIFNKFRITQQLMRSVRYAKTAVSNLTTVCRCLVYLPSIYVGTYSQQCH